MHQETMVPLGEVPYTAEFGGHRIQVTEVGNQSIRGSYVSGGLHNRFEVHVSYMDGSRDWFSVLADSAAPSGLGTPSSPGAPSSAATGFSIDVSAAFRSIRFDFKAAPDLNFTLTTPGRRAKNREAPASTGRAVLLFDVSDLVYYIGHHDNLTGIQRVQACVLLGLLQSHPTHRREYISFNNKLGDFNIIDPIYFEALMVDLSLPVGSRSVAFDPMEARLGILPQSAPLTYIERAADQRLIVYLLGAAWVNRDYFHRILDLKRNFDAQFCMTIHDLIPIYARETCDQGTAIVFEEFLRKSFLFTDHYFTVSAYTAYDLHRFAAALGYTNVPISVIENGHSFDEFIPPRRGVGTSEKELRRFGRDGFVLFVSTIEGRKNHSYIFDVWEELSRTRPNLPVLLCVGRFGWRAESFLEKMLLTDNLGNKIRVLSEISDSQLDALYANCLFTVYPSVYEGWGLPAGESLSKGKLCAMSDRSSLPEVAGEFGVYFDIDSVADGVEKVGRLIDDTDYRRKREQDVKERFTVRTWSKVATELVAYVEQLPPPRTPLFPILKIGQEYKLSQLPPRNISALGAAMISQVQSARRGPLTGHMNRDDDLLAAQSSRQGAGWCSPEDWGTWARYPDCNRLYYVRPEPGTREVIIYERVRVVGALVGSTLTVSLNEGPARDVSIEQERFLLRVSGPVEIDARGFAELQLRYRLHGPQGIAARLDEIDGRRLGLGIESTLVLQDSDIQLRLTIIETALSVGALGLGRPRVMRADARLPPPRRRKGIPVIENGDMPAPVADEVVTTFASERLLDAPKIEVGESVLLGRETFLLSRQPTSALLGQGWYPLEAEAVWSDAIQATVNFRLPADAERVFMLGVELRCIASRGNPASVHVLLNDVEVWSDAITGGDFMHRRFIVDSAISPYDKAFVAVFEIDRLISPEQMELGNDRRPLGVQVRSLSVEAIPRLAPNVTQTINGVSDAGRALVSGWYPLEASGCWSVAEGGRIVASVEGQVATSGRSVRLTIEGRVFGTERTGPAVVDLVVQGDVLSRWRFEDDGVCQQTAILPLVKVGDRQLLDVTLVRRDGVSPADVGGGDDMRRLGVFAMGMIFADVDLMAAEGVRDDVEVEALT